MSRRTDRIGNLLRESIAQLLLRKLSDPRIDPARTSVTRVEVQEDLLAAKVYVTVLGTEADERRVLRALQHASGHIQGLMMDKISLRHTPILDFQIDTRYKKTLETLEIIERAMDEIREKSGCDDESGGDSDPAPASPQSPPRSRTPT